MADGTLKPGWRRVKFGDVVRLNTERVADPAAAGLERYVGLDHIEPEDLRIRRWGLVADGTTFTNRFRPGQVLFGKRRAYQRKVAVADFDGVCSGDIYIFESKDSSVLLPDLLPFLCQTEGFFEHAVGTSAGSLSPRTNWTQLAQYEFGLPPLEEQRKVAYLLRQANEYRDNLAESVHGSIALRASLVKQRSIELASQYQFTTLQAAISTIQAGTSPPSSGRVAAADEHGVLKVSAVGDWQFYADENKAISRDLFVPNLEVRDGDFLVTRANADPDSVGRTCIVTATRSGLMLSDKTWRLLPLVDYNPIGLLAWTKTPVFRKHVRKSIGGTEAKNVSQEAFLTGPFPNCPPAILNSLAAEVEVILGAIYALQDRLKTANAMITQIANKVLMG